MLGSLFFNYKSHYREHFELTINLFKIPEYCKTIEEKEINDHSFDLLFAFDEIIALGYRENVNLAQIRTFTDMESHEEKVYKAMREVSLTLYHNY